MFGSDLVEGCLSHLHSMKKYYDTNEGKAVLDELHKLCKHHNKYLRGVHQRNEHTDHQIGNNKLKF